MQKKKYMKRMLVMATLGVTMALGTVGMTAEAAAQTDKAQTNVQTQQAAADTKVQGESNSKLTTEWDKVFPESRDVNHRKVTFHNRYGIELAADLYEPKKITGKLAAVAVSGPFGAVKEQSSGLYAQELAKRGFLTIAFDPSFTGESGGVNGVRNVASPDINTEDFSAAVDFLSNEKDVDPDRIGILGICGWGGMALNAAAMDTRIKATVVSTMYDMSRVMANGYFDYDKDEETIKKERMANRAGHSMLSAPRTTARARTSGRAVSSTRCRPMPRSSSRITTLITRRSAAIIRVP